MTWIHEQGLAEIDRIDATAGLRAEQEAIPFKTQKACTVHGPFIPCTDDCPKVQATYSMKRDGKRGARLLRGEDGRMAVRFNFKRPQGICCGLSFGPRCWHENKEKDAGHDGKVELYCVACGKRVA